MLVPWVYCTAALVLLLGLPERLPLQAAAVPLTWTAVWHVVGTHYLDIWGLAALTSSCCCDLPISAKVSGLPSLVGGSAEKVVRWALGSPGGCGEGVYSWAGGVPP